MQDPKSGRCSISLFPLKIKMVLASRHGRSTSVHVMTTKQHILNTNNTVQSYFWLEVIFGDIISFSFCLFSACGKPLTITPGSTMTLTSPGYPDPVDRGVVCQWSVNTTGTYLIQYRFVLIDLTEDSQTEEHSCNDAFISLSDDERPTVKICRNRTEHDIKRGSVDKISFTSGIRSRIRKFKVLITATGKMNYHYMA